jgi:RHS repeat-associated protein
VRLVFSDLNGDGSVDLVNPLNEILQEQHYYPFGMNLGGLDYVQGIANAYQFNGKEKQTDHGLNWYDYGARMYDAVIGRWGGVDANATNYPNSSLYQYSYNNPIYFKDVNGKDGVGYIGEDGKLYLEATYYVVSEGKGSFTAAQRDELQSIYNEMMNSIVGMKVLLPDGNEYIIGGSNINLVAGGTLNDVYKRVVLEEGANALIKVPLKYITDRSSDNALGLSTNDIGGKTVNTTYIASENANDFRIGDTQLSYENTIKDEAAHIFGARHPRDRQKGESKSEYKAYLTKFGRTERKEKVNREVSLDQQDVQNIINSLELKIIENPYINRK